MACILVIDDNEALLETVKVILARHGHAVRTAPDGRCGMIAMGRHSVDLVITDIVMPQQGGIETILQLRASAPGLPILAISGGGGGMGHRGLLEAAARLGATDTLAKPFGAAALLAKVNALLQTVIADVAASRNAAA